MTRHGSDESGFSIDLRGSVALVRAWGFWNSTLAAEFAPTVLAACQPANRPLRMLLDGSHLKPQEDDGQQAFRALFTGLSQSGLARAAIVVTNPITKMQLKRITKELPGSTWVYVATTTTEPDLLGMVVKPER